MRFLKYFHVFCDSIVASQKNVIKEVRVLRKLHHPYIIKLKNAFIVDSNLIIVMEYAGGGELKEYMKTREKLDESEARNIFRQILDAIAHCHAHNVIHRDLKMENVLFSDTDHKHIKLVDFGIAGLVLDENTAEKSKAGSLKYMAPEVLSGENLEARPALDIWGMGCMLFGMVCGELPFNGKSSIEIIEKIKKGEYQFPHNSTVSYQCRKLIRSMLNVDATKRISVREIMLHPWMTESDKESTQSNTRKTPSTPLRKTPSPKKQLIKKVSDIGIFETPIKTPIVINPVPKKPKFNIIQMQLAHVAQKSNIKTPMKNIARPQIIRKNSKSKNSFVKLPIVNNPLDNQNVLEMKRRNASDKKLVTAYKDKIAAELALAMGLHEKRKYLSGTSKPPIPTFKKKVSKPKIIQRMETYYTPETNDSRISSSEKKVHATPRVSPFPFKLPLKSAKKLDLSTASKQEEDKNYDS